MGSARGFTIVEIAIVLVITALIISTILAASFITEAAKVHSVIKEHGLFQEAVTAFKEKYGELPGDMGNATTYWPAAANGDRDQKIIWADGTAPKKEGPQAWYQLEQAGMLTGGGFSGASTSDVAVPGTNIPSSAIAPESAGWFLDADAAYPIGSALGLGRADATGLNDSAVLRAETAMKVDRKLDDGKPSAGNVRGIGANCIDTGVYDADGANKNNETCTMRFGLYATIHNRDLN